MYWVTWRSLLADARRRSNDGDPTTTLNSRAIDMCLGPTPALDRLLAHLNVRKNSLASSSWTSTCHVIMNGVPLHNPIWR